MKLTARLLLLLLVVVLLVPTAGLYMAASTQAGLRFIAARLVRIGPASITIEHASGTLVDGFTIGSLHVRDPHADVLITGASGKLRLWPLLLRRHIELASAAAREVRVQILPYTGHGSGAPHFMPATMAVEVDAAHADSVDLLRPQEPALHASGAAAGIEVLPGEIRIRNGQLDWEAAHLQVDGRVRATSPLGLAGHLAVDWRPAGKPAWQFTTDFDGDEDRLPLKLDIARPFHAHAEGAATGLGRGWKLAGNGATRDLDLSVFGAGNALGILSAQVAVTVTARGFTVNGPVTAPGLRIGAIQADLHGAYADRQLTLGDSTLLHRPSGTRATVHGTVDFGAGEPVLKLAGGWTTLRWPMLDGPPAFTSRQGQYTLEGTRPWQVTASGEIAAAGVSGMTGSMRGTLDKGSFTIEQASLALLGGNAVVSGQAQWEPAENWHVSGHMTGLDPTQLRADLPGRLDFDFRAGGAPFGAAGDIDFAVSHLAGKLRGQTATGSGEFARAGGSTDWRFHQVDLRVGQARMQLDGNLGTPRDVRFAIDADDLSLLQADAEGRLSARGRIAGTNEMPLLLFKARGTAFQWQGYRVDELDADVDLDLGRDGHAQGKVELAGIHHGERTLQYAALQVSGSGERQRVTLDLNAAPLRSSLVAEGALEKGAWHGTVQSLSVNDDAELALRLQQPAAVTVDRQHAEVGNLCLTGEHARGCVAGRRDAQGRWGATFTAQDMPLRAFTAGLTQDMDYEGTINLSGELTGAPLSLPTGTVSGELMQAELRHDVGGGSIQRIPLGSGTVQVAATASGFSAQVALDAGDGGSIAGRLAGERNTGEWRQYPIHGQLDARTAGLSLLDMYVGGIDKATGQLTTHVDISGTLGNPLLAGQLQVRDATIDVYQSGTAIRDLSLDAHFDTQALDLTGKARLGDGSATFNGKLTWRGDEPYGNLHMEGDGLRLVDVPEARIDASPRLDFRMTGHHIDASGEVVIPKANLVPADLTNTVLVSGDEVLVGAPPVDAQQRWTVVSSIKLTLGNDVNLDSLGLKARLGGTLTVGTDAAGTTSGNGEVTIKSGQYRGLGRSLDITSGRLIFRGPLNDPGVELRAEKQFPDPTAGDVTAGVNVRGTLRAPQVTFYSNADLPQSQIASLILAGGSLDSAQNSDRPGAARNELLTQGIPILAQRLGNRIGIEDIGLESDNISYDRNTGATTSDTSVVVGKYLSPRLYISYGISLVEAVNTFKMRWTIGKGWMLKTEAGQARSADIVYTIQKGRKDKSKAAETDKKTSPPP